MPPVGLQGELRMTARVAVVIAASSGSAGMRKPSSRGGTTTTGGPAKRDLLGEGHPARRVHDDLVAVFEERQRDLEERALPPTVIASAARAPRRAVVAAVALGHSRRRAGMPATGCTW